MEKLEGGYFQLSLHAILHDHLLSELRNYLSLSFFPLNQLLQQEVYPFPSILRLGATNQILTLLSSISSVNCLNF